MKKSRKRTSRGKIRRHRQLEKQKKRIADRDEAQYDGEDLSGENFFSKYLIEILFVIVFLIAIATFVMFGSHNSHLGEDPYISKLSSQAWQWRDRYPQGYKVIVLEGEDIRSTSYDELPDSLIVDWEKLSIQLTRESQVNGFIEKVEVTIPGIDHVPSGISGTQVRATILRQKGSRGGLITLGNLRLVVEIVEDTGNQIFLLFGLQGKFAQ